MTSEQHVIFICIHLKTRAAEEKGGTRRGSAVCVAPTRGDAERERREKGDSILNSIRRHNAGFVRWEEERGRAGMRGEGSVKDETEGWRGSGGRRGASAEPAKGGIASKQSCEKSDFDCVRYGNAFQTT